MPPPMDRRVALPDHCAAAPRRPPLDCCLARERSRPTFPASIATPPSCPTPLPHSETPVPRMPRSAKRPRTEVSAVYAVSGVGGPRPPGWFCLPFRLG